MSEPTCPECAQPSASLIEIRGVYDGALIRVCGQGHMWPRFEAPDWLHDRALEIIAGWGESNG